MEAKSGRSLSEYCMIELENIENHVKLKCEVVGYQFPNNHKDNWCLLKVDIKQGDKSFEKIDPALETTELVELREWFKSLSKKRLPRFAKLTFTEPGISFEFLACINEQVRISIKLSHEIKPNFMLEQFRSEHSDWIIVFELNDKDFDKTICGIEAAIKHFPTREE